MTIEAMPYNVTIRKAPKKNPVKAFPQKYPTEVNHNRIKMIRHIPLKSCSICG